MNYGFDYSCLLMKFWTSNLFCCHFCKLAIFFMSFIFRNIVQISSYTVNKSLIGLWISNCLKFLNYCFIAFSRFWVPNAFTIEVRVVKRFMTTTLSIKSSMHVIPLSWNIKFSQCSNSRNLIYSVVILFEYRVLSIERTIKEPV